MQFESTRQPVRCVLDWRDVVIEISTKGVGDVILAAGIISFDVVAVLWQ